ncbi:molybdopterin molybdotransferase MoeA [Paenibacillus sp. P25]|nr:molybdopterin molybdotransferase MoeA [Paenibacillus sp. P25]
MELRFGRKAITLEEAQQLAAGLARELETETAGLAEAYGRRLAYDLTADAPVPHFRRSGVDGYAVTAADGALAAPDRPVSLEVTEVLPAGTVPKKRLEPGQAARIMTGGVVPEGAEAVIMLEMTDRPEPSEEPPYEVRIRKAMSPGENITPAGQEIRPGEQSLRKGQRIGPGEAAILATFGCDPVPVFRRPRVAIFSTGSELLPVNAPLTAGKIRNSNSYMLAAGEFRRSCRSFRMTRIRWSPGFRPPWKRMRS